MTRNTRRGSRLVLDRFAMARAAAPSCLATRSPAGLGTAGAPARRSLSRIAVERGSAITLPARPLHLAAHTSLLGLAGLLPVRRVRAVPNEREASERWPLRGGFFGHRASVRSSARLDDLLHLVETFATRPLLASRSRPESCLNTSEPTEAMRRPAEGEPHGCCRSSLRHLARSVSRYSFVPIRAAPTRNALRIAAAPSGKRASSLAPNSRPLRTTSERLRSGSQDARLGR